MIGTVDDHASPVQQEIHLTTRQVSYTIEFNISKSIN